MTALGRLTRAVGRTVLTAATDDEPALEGYRGHGVFTYALLDAIGQADRNGDGVVDVTELAAYVDERVQQVSLEAFKVAQVPQMKIVGSNFPLTSRLAVLTGAPAGRLRQADARGDRAGSRAAVGGRQRSRRVAAFTRPAGGAGRERQRLGADRPRRQEARLRRGEGAPAPAIDRRENPSVIRWQ